MPFDGNRKSAGNAVVSPFPDSYTGEAGAEGVNERPSAFVLSESPFLSEYPDAQGEAPDPMAEAVDELLETLHVDELDEAIAGLTDELRGVVAADPAFETDNEVSREAMLRARVAPLLAAARADLRRIAEAFARLDPHTATEAEYHEAIDAAPLPEVDSPAFEFFLDGLRKKLRGVVSSVASLAMKGLSPALGFVLKPLLAKLEPLAKQVLDKVVAFALDKVPAEYRPLAAALAARLRGKLQDAAGALVGKLPSSELEAPAELGAAPAPSQEAVPDTAQAQRELDLALAEVVLGADRAEREDPSVMHAAEAEPAPARDPYADLARARERFVREVGEATDAAEAQVAVEHFLPAVMLALRTGIRLIGRPRVVGFLGGLIAKLIGPLIGKDKAPLLGKILADLGLRTFLQAEVDPATELQCAGETIASTVEETVRRVAQLPDELLDEPEALATFAREAFDGAVAASFPSTLVRPELRETEHAGAWVLLPARRRPRYKKFSHIFDVVVTPAMARAVRGHGSSSLAGILRDRLRLSPDAIVHGRVHLYEAVPGTSLAAIAQGESVRGLGSADPAVSSQLQPLTSQAALLLAGSPALGRELSDTGEADPPRLGERLYFLEVAGAPARPLGHESHLRVVVNVRKEQVHLGLYLSEVVAQKVATALREKKPAAAVIAELRTLLAPATAAVGKHHPHARGLVRVRGLRKAEAAGERHAPAARAARHAARLQAARLALHWAWAYLAKHLDEIAADFIAKTDGPEDGVRLGFTFRVPGLAGASALFTGAASSAPSWPPSGPAQTTLTLHPGPRLG